VEGETPIGEAMRWVSSITTVGAMMVLPVLGAQWLSTRWDWLNPWCAPLALAVGVSTGFYYLMCLVRHDTALKNKAINDKALKDKTPHETATGETATGETATGETATGETATGETATDEAAKREAD